MLLSADTIILSFWVFKSSAAAAISADISRYLLGIEETSGVAARNQLCVEKTVFIACHLKENQEEFR